MRGEPYNKYYMDMAHIQHLMALCESVSEGNQTQSWHVKARQQWTPQRTQTLDIDESIYTIDLPVLYLCVLEVCTL